MNAAESIDRLSSRARGLYRCSLLAGLTSASIAAMAAYPVHLGQPSLVVPGLAAAGGVAAFGLFVAYKAALRPVTKFRSRQAGLREAFAVARRSSSKRVDELFESSPVVRADALLAESVSRLKEAKAGAEAAYRSRSWWGKLTIDPPDLSEMEEKIDKLEAAKWRLDQSGKLQKARSVFDALEARSQDRLDASEIDALRSVPSSHLDRYDEKAVAKSAIWLSAMSIPVSAWSDISQAGNIYDTLREVNRNYADMSDIDIWITSLTLPGESLAGLVSLTKGAYFEKLVEADFGGERFEHFNHPDTDILVDGVAYQIKATDSTSYVNSVADDIPVISTTEVTLLTGSIDGGYSDEELAGAVELALGGSVVDILDTTVDAVLTGVGGLTLMATLRGINHAATRFKDGRADAILGGLGVAATGTVKNFVDTAELGYKALTSRPGRFVGRMAGRAIGSVVDRIDRKLSDG